MNPLIERLGWTLLHSLWQGSLVWVALKVAFPWLRRCPGQARYLAACGALVLAVVAPLVTFFQLDVAQRLSGPLSPSGLAPAVPGVITAASPTRALSIADAPPAASSVAAPAARLSPSPPTASHPGSGRFGSILRPALPWLVGLWLAGFAGSSLRLLLGWRQTLALARGPLLPLPVELEARFVSLLARLKLRRTVRIGLSACVRGPAVVGWLRPVVLLPLEALAGLTPGQIEALLLHELAHIRRTDFLVNLLQSVTEALFFYHPAIHAINRLVREEREHACDDLAVTLTGDPVGYARALATLAAPGVSGGFALAATGTGGTGGLIDRVRRLLGHAPARPRPLATLAWAALAGAVLYLVALLGLPALTVRMLTPEERIAIVRHTTAVVAAQTTPEFAEGTRMTVVCEVRTEDGSPLPANLVVTGLTQNPHRSVSADVRVVDGRVRQSVAAGEYYLLLYAPGWAPTFAGPIRPSHADEELVLSPLILRRGFPARLQVTDQDGHPLAGALLHQPWLWRAGPAGTRTINRPLPDLVTDANGEVVFANVGSDTELEVTVEQPGFQKNIRAFNGFTPDALLVFPLTPARPTPGQVTDADTGLPIPGAQILLAGHQRPETASGASLKDAVRLATANEDGRFVLDTLNDRWTTYVYVTAPGYAPTSVEATIATPLQVRLDRGIRISGRVRAAAGQLRGQTSITADYSLRTGPYSAYDHRVGQTLDPASPEPAFAFELLPRSADSISITVAGRSLSLPGDADHADLLIDLTSNASQAPGTLALGELPTRKVVLTLHPPAGEPMPEGELGLAYQPHGLNRTGGSNWPPPLFPVRHGQVELVLPVPNRLQVSQARLPGYAPVSRSFEIPEGPNPLLLDLEVVPAGAVHGRLTDAQGAPIPGWFLSCGPGEPEESRPPVALDQVFWGDQKTNVTGGFIAGGLPFDHDYILVAHQDLFYATIPFRLTHQAPLQSLEWRLPPATSCSGRLVGPGGQPVSAASLELSFRARPDYSFVNSARVVTETDGSFEIRGLNSAELGRYEIQLVSREHWQPFVAALPHAPRTEGRTFTLTAGHPLSGRMLDAVTGRPRAGIDVRAYRVYEDERDMTPQARLPILAESKTDSDGRFRFSTFPAGKFRLASDQGNVKGPTVVLPDQAGANLDFRLE